MTQQLLPVLFSPAKWDDVIDALHVRMMQFRDPERRKHYRTLILSLERQRDAAAKVLK